jgi:hypothetical protein
LKIDGLKTTIDDRADDTADDRLWTKIIYLLRLGSWVMARCMG